MFRYVTYEGAAEMLTIYLNVANLRVNQRSQINEDTVEPSLAAQDINPIAYAPDPILHPAPDSYPVRSSW